MANLQGYSRIILPKLPSIWFLKLDANLVFEARITAVTSSKTKPSKSLSFHLFNASKRGKTYDIITLQPMKKKPLYNEVNFAQLDIPTHLEVQNSSYKLMLETICLEIIYKYHHTLRGQQPWQSNPTWLCDRQFSCSLAFETHRGSVGAFDRCWFFGGVNKKSPPATSLSWHLHRKT